jgi:hypothetical protein
MPSSGILRSVAIVRIGVSEKRVASLIGVTRIGEAMNSYCYRLPSSPILFTLQMEATCSSETSVLNSQAALHPRRRHSSYSHALSKEADVSALSSESITKRSLPPASTCFLTGLLFDLNMEARFLRNVGLPVNYVPLQPRRRSAAVTAVRSLQ